VWLAFRVRFISETIKMVRRNMTPVPTKVKVRPKLKTTRLKPVVSCPIPTKLKVRKKLKDHEAEACGVVPGSYEG